MLYELDVWLFYAINHGWQNPVFDVIMPVITSTTFWIPIYVVGIGALLIWGGKRGRWCAVVMVVAIATLDPLSHNLLKETINRPRPYLSLGYVHQLVGSGGGSFPSNHAMNNAALAVILSSFYPMRKYWWIAIALAVCVSRVYVGVHYASDVLGGALIGASAAWLLVRLQQHLQLWLEARSASNPRQS